MRQIKFRGKQKDNGEWVCGNLVVLDYHNSFDYVVASEIVLSNGHVFEVHPETIGEFVGLLDKKGVEIYEGDIVRVTFDGEHPSVHKVYYGIEHSYPAFDLEPDLDVECNGLQHCVVTGESEIEIIGNIYENPELLK